MRLKFQRNSIPRRGASLPGAAILGRRLPTKCHSLAIRICSDLLLRADHFRPVARGLNKTRLLFEFVVLDTRPERIKEEFRSSLSEIKAALQTMRSDVEQFEKALPSFVAREFQGRKRKLLEQDQILASLEIPIKRVGSATKFFGSATTSGLKWSVIHHCTKARERKHYEISFS